MLNLLVCSISCFLVIGIFCISLAFAVSDYREFTNETEICNNSINQLMRIIFRIILFCLICLLFICFY